MTAVRRGAAAAADRWHPPARDRWPLWSAYAGVLGPPLFLAAMLVQGYTRPGFDQRRLPVSALSLGDLGWLQVVNFVVLGVLELAFAGGLLAALGGHGPASITAPALVAGFGLAVLGAGAFRPDPGGGWPPGQAASPAGTVGGLLHDVCTLLVFLSLTGLAAAIAWRMRYERHQRAALTAALVAVATVAGFAVMVVGYNTTGALASIAGIEQRAVIAVAWGWLTWLALFTARRLRLERPF